VELIYQWKRTCATHGEET